MVLYHVTNRRNAAKIRLQGIDPGKAKGKRKASWFVKGDQLPWAMLHVQQRHGWTLKQLVILPVDLPATEFSEHAGQQLYYRLVLTERPVIGPEIRPEDMLKPGVNDDDQWGKDMDAEFARLHPESV